MKYAGIFFDMDGTLLETGPLWDHAVRIALDAHGIEFTEEEYFSLGGVLLKDILKAKGYDEATIKSVHDARSVALLPVFRADARWRIDAREVVGAIAVPKGIVTSAHNDVVDALEEGIGIRSAVDIVVTAEDVEPDYKPHPKGLLIACKRLGLDPKQCLYIGDQACDRDAAAAAGMDFILTRGTHTPKDLECEKVIDEITELSDYLK